MRAVGVGRVGLIRRVESVRARHHVPFDRVIVLIQLQPRRAVGAGRLVDRRIGEHDLLVGSQIGRGDPALEPHDRAGAEVQGIAVGGVQVVVEYVGRHGAGLLMRVDSQTLTVVPPTQSFQRRRVGGRLHLPLGEPDEAQVDHQRGQGEKRKRQHYEHHQHVTGATAPTAALSVAERRTP